MASILANYTHNSICRTFCNFYLEEEETYPELNKWLQKMRGKFNQFWLSLSTEKAAREA